MRQRSRPGPSTEGSSVPRHLPNHTMCRRTGERYRRGEVTIRRRGTRRFAPKGTGVLNGSDGLMGFRSTKRMRDRSIAAAPDPRTERQHVGRGRAGASRSTGDLRLNQGRWARELPEDERAPNTNGDPGVDCPQRFDYRLRLWLDA